MAAIKGKLVVGTVMLSCFSVAAQAQAPAPLWTFDADAPIRSSPAIVPDGTIYFGAYGTLYAITNRGSNAWEFPTQNARDCSPAVAADGTIYYSSMTPGSPGSGYLYAISPKGTEKWRYPSQGGNGSPAIAADGTIYTTGGYYVHAVSPEGTNRWKYPIEGGDYSSFVSPTVEQDGSLCVGSIDSRAYYFLTMFGGLVSSFSLAPSGPGDSSAVGNDGTVYFTGRPLYAFSPNGTNLWASQTNSFEGSSPATGKDGTIYVATSGSSLCAFSPTGEFKWQVLTNGAIRGVTPTIDSAGTIYYPAYSVLYAISPTGNVLWSYPLIPDPGDMFNGSQTSPTIGPDGNIYVTSANRLYAFSGTNKLADSPWPMYRQNPRHTGKIERPSLQQPKKRSDGNFQFQLYAQLGETQMIQTSTDLASWTSLTNVAVTNVPTDAVDLSASNFAFKFYRTLSQ